MIEVETRPRWSERRETIIQRLLHTVGAKNLSFSLAGGTGSAHIWWAHVFMRPRDVSTLIFTSPRKHLPSASYSVVGPRRACYTLCYFSPRSRTWTHSGPVRNVSIRAVFGVLAGGTRCWPCDLLGGIPGEKGRERFILRPVHDF